ncbi:hypothetical protein N9R81_04600 [Flavobacteriales bacterium]|nr:hypothetical protein [Flavobacteriales bacterium]
MKKKSISEDTYTNATRTQKLIELMVLIGRYINRRCERAIFRFGNWIYVRSHAFFEDQEWEGIELEDLPKNLIGKASKRKWLTNRVFSPLITKVWVALVTCAIKVRDNYQKLSITKLRGRLNLIIDI